MKPFIKREKTLKTIIGMTHAEYLNLFIKYLDKFIGEKRIFLERHRSGTCGSFRKSFNHSERFRFFSSVKKSTYNSMCWFFIGLFQR